MIDPKDLRIGNLVSCEVIGDTYTDRKPYYGECIFAVTGLRGGFVWLDIGHDAEQKVPCDHVQPIPLAKEWMIMAGFELTERGTYQIPKTGRFVYHPEYGWKILENWVRGWVNVQEPTYVHQLQNLYLDLTCEELQFKTQQP